MGAIPRRLENLATAHDCTDLTSTWLDLVFSPRVVHLGRHAQRQMALTILSDWIGRDIGVGVGSNRLCVAVGAQPTAAHYRAVGGCGSLRPFII